MARLTLLIQCGQILAHRAGRMPGIAQVLHLFARRTAATIGIGSNHTGVDGKAFAANQSFLHTPLDHALEHMPKRFALTEAAMPVLRERRMVRHSILEAQATEPAIRQIEVDLFAQPPLGTNAKAVTHDQHRYPQHPSNSTRPPRAL